MRLINNTKIDFMSKTSLTTLASAILIICGLASMITKGGPKLSIDFKGGTLIALDFNQNINIEKIRTVLAKTDINGQIFDFSKNEIKYFGKPSSVSFRIANLENEPEKFSENFIDFIRKSFPDYMHEEKSKSILAIEKVGPKVGAELSGDAFMAILSSLILILIYVSFRFEWKYAVGAILALTHDIVITLGIFSLLDYEISLAVVAAFLTIVGYSLNDTIVIFDRIRENRKNRKNISLYDTVNQSINESLSRTVVTSLTTFFVVLVLFLFGGEVIHTFAFAMIIGVIIGTYSSIFIASNVVVKMGLSKA
tara:strand:+ start:6497 stop:7423 length:927 start_codon:yes stop_codon:yes gene_type:complete